MYYKTKPLCFNNNRKVPGNKYRRCNVTEEIPAKIPADYITDLFVPCAYSSFSASLILDVNPV
jgi:hypothetical protein